MTSEEFVIGFYKEREHLMNLYFHSESETEVGQMIQSLQLDEERVKVLKQIMNGAIRDVMYTILLGLDGEAAIGDRQEPYRLMDEDNNELTGGEIESCAWEYFQNRE
ncbi:MAG: hypothetical protein WBA23_12540 [Tunicatimonas sp.]|uniref:hypothetical protein n=1 Tax=Tunicatimonas sp. TaxID=1940096 RepID=UPI003C73FA38